MPSKNSVYLSRNRKSIEARLRLKYSMMKAHARTRGIEWHLTFNDVLELWNNQQGKSAYTGRKLYLTIGRGWSGPFGRNRSISIERLDPTGAYTKDNVVLIRYSENNQKKRTNFFSVDFMETYPEVVSRVLALKPELQAIA